VAGLSVTVDQRKIAASFGPGGSIMAHAYALAESHERIAKKIAPRRSGYLSDNHFSAIRRDGPYGIEYTVGVNDRVWYVDALRTGTPAQIVSNRPPITYTRAFRYKRRRKGQGLFFYRTYRNQRAFMEMRPSPHSYYRHGQAGAWKQEVKGQPPHPKREWLMVAASAAFKQHRL
jgi:hypothetical protein